MRREIAGNSPAARGFPPMEMRVLNPLMVESLANLCELLCINRTPVSEPVMTPCFDTPIIPKAMLA